MSPPSRLLFVCVVALLVLGPADLAGQVPLGDPFWIHESADGRQTGPVVVAQASGSFVVFWNSEGPDGDGFGVRMRRFSQLGAALTPELPVNQTTAGHQFAVDADLGPGSTLIVVWTSSDETGSEILVRLFAPDLTPLTDEIPLTPGPEDVFRLDPSIDALPDGRYAVSWRSSAEGENVRAAVFDSPAVPLIGELEVSPTIPPASGFNRQAVALLADGQFAVLWEGRWEADASNQVFIRLFDNAGNPSSPELLVSVPGEFAESFGPDLAAVSDGRYRAVWEHVENLEQTRLYTVSVTPPASIGPVQPLGVAIEGFITFAALDSGEFVVTAGDEGFRYDAEAEVVATFYPFLLDNWAVTPLSGSTGELIVVKPVHISGGDYDLIAQLLTSRLFADGFESGDTTAWSSAMP
jgi:hypothetical protein